MKIELARCIPEPMRQGMTAEAMALAYDASTSLGKRAVLQAIAAVMESIGDPVGKFWIEDGAGKRRTYKIEQASAQLKEFGLIIRGRSAASARTLNRMGSSVRYQC
jgi:hypothetical protein